jgi:hypothetical protein
MRKTSGVKSEATGCLLALVMKPVKSTMELGYERAVRVEAAGSLL